MRPLTLTAFARAPVEAGQPRLCSHSTGRVPSPPSSTPNICHLHSLPLCTRKRPLTSMLESQLLAELVSTRCVACQYLHGARVYGQRPLTFQHRLWHPSLRLAKTISQHRSRRLFCGAPRRRTPWAGGRRGGGGGGGGSSDSGLAGGGQEPLSRPDPEGKGGTSDATLTRWPKFETT